MIVVCPHCQRKLRIHAAQYVGKKLSLSCRNCGAQFSCKIPSAKKILLAHGDPEVCRAILDVCRLDTSEIVTCADAATARQALQQYCFSVLLLDVALPGIFPFQLIDEIQQSGESILMILLPSVYNRTAYKRRPSSLYGADAYLELHHLSDRLIPLLHELAPELALSSRPYSALSDEGEERSLSPAVGLNEQAEELARMLMADIALYHQEAIDLGILQQDLETRLAPQLSEGRQMLARRIPQVDLDKQDFLLKALFEFASARERELGRLGVGRHD